MPEVAQEVPITSVLGAPRPAFSRHTFRGANAFMLRLLNRHRAELGVTALPQELNAAAERAMRFLATESARLTIGAVERSAGTLDFTVSVENLGGHKLPTAYPSRRVWLHVRASDASGNVIFESGAMRADGSIVGNDNDDDPGRFEPHHRIIRSGDDVQIYEPVLADRNGGLTTGLLTGVRYIKDNRLLPRGFDKATAAQDVAVNGDASADPDFLAGIDSIRYVIDVSDASGAVTVEVELNYQSIGFRWAENLKDYAAPEPARFVAYYAEAASDSKMPLATAMLVSPL